MHVIQCRPEVPLRSHCSLCGLEEDLAAACVLLSIPGVRCATMKPAQLVQKGEDVGGSNQHVVMIRQDAPREDPAVAGGKHAQQIPREGVQTRWAVADMGLVFKTHGGDMEMLAAGTSTVRR